MVITTHAVSKNTTRTMTAALLLLMLWSSPSLLLAIY